MRGCGWGSRLGYVRVALHSAGLLLVLALSILGLANKRGGGIPRESAVPKLDLGQEGIECLGCNKYTCTRRSSLE